MEYIYILENKSHKYVIEIKDKLINLNILEYLILFERNKIQIVSK